MHNEMASSSSRCAVCGIISHLKCVGCKTTYYCGKDHQKLHWKKTHKYQCKCYEIVKNDQLGRHLRATRDIKCGEIILREMPLICGPKMASQPVCLGCHRKLQAPSEQAMKNYYKCRKCSWPLCSAECEKGENHLDECLIMSSRNFYANIEYNVDDDKNGKKYSAYCVILPLRCMLLKQKNPTAYQKFTDLEDHLSERITTPLYNVLKVNLVTFVKVVLGLDEWTEEDILRVAAILDTNAFEMRQMDKMSKVRAIYPAAAMFSHDCTPNARHTFNNHMEIIFLAKTPIAKGDVISISYTQPLKSTLMRRQHLMQAKCFDCTCVRCKDATELSTYAGSILCSQCKIGKIVSTNPMNNLAVWQCQLCPHQLSAKQINLGNAAIQKEIDSLNKNCPRSFEEFQIRYSDVLHETNTHMLQVKYALTQMYGIVPGFTLHEMNDAAIERKILLCKELLEVANIVDAGYSLFRGKLLIDLQDCLVIKTKRQYLQGAIDQEGAQRKLMEAMEILKEAIDILKLEQDLQQLLNERCQFLEKELNDNK